MTGSFQLIKLTTYDAARSALAKARTVDDVRKIRGTAEQMKAYARVSKDKKMMLDTKEIRDRAARRLGEIMEHKRKPSDWQRARLKRALASEGTNVGPNWTRVPRALLPRLESTSTWRTEREH